MSEEKPVVFEPELLKKSIERYEKHREEDPDGKCSWCEQVNRNLEALCNSLKRPVVIGYDPGSAKGDFSLTPEQIRWFNERRREVLAGEMTAWNDPAREYEIDKFGEVKLDHKGEPVPR